MKVFVTGGTGFVGREVVRQLHQAGHLVRLLVRHPDSAALNEIKTYSQPEIHRGDALDSSSLEYAFSGVEATIHLVGIISECGASTYENVHVRATQNLIHSAQAAGVKRFLHMSALGTRQGATSRYHKTKWAAELAVRQSGLAFTIFRPSLIYGPRDQFVNLFARISRFSPVLPVMGSRRARFQPVSVQAVAAAFVAALTDPKSEGQTYDLCGPEVFTFPEILDQILGVTNRTRWKLRIPLAVARSQAALLEWFFPRLLGKAPPLNRDQLTMLQEDNVGQGRAADELFNLKHRLFKEGIAEYLRN